MNITWINKSYKISPFEEDITILNKSVIKTHLDKFYSEVISKIKDTQHILLIPRVQLNDNHLISLSNKLEINNNNSIKDVLLDYLMDRIGLSNDAYKNVPINSIIFSYGVREGKIVPQLGIVKRDIKSHIYYKNKLPLGVLPIDYGNILLIDNNNYTIALNKKVIIILKQEKEVNLSVNYIKYIKNGQILFSWKDKILSQKPDKLIRTIGKTVIHFEDGIVTQFRVQKKTTGMTNKIITKSNSLSNKFITMDFETIIAPQWGKQIPYLLCWYDGINTYSYFITDFLDKDKSIFSLNLEEGLLKVRLMIKKAMEDINRKKYKNYKIYFHNFAKFDGIFLITQLAEIGQTKPQIFKGKLISTKFNLFNSKYLVTFLDSLLMLNASLKDLCKSFGLPVEYTKGIFPFKLFDINYIGLFPNYNLFDNKVSLEEYIHARSEFGESKLWNFRTESIKYCKLDCIALHKILAKFNGLIFNKFKIDITKYPTLPSLAFGIFRTHYLVLEKDIKKDKKGNFVPTPSKIHMLSGKIAEDLRAGYTGGAVDVYIPSFKEETDSIFDEQGSLMNIVSKKIHVYDVNSLYPSVMVNMKMPVGAPTYFEGDIFKINPDAFGFFYCKIVAPEGLMYPILQTHVKMEAGTRTVAPLGNWEGMYFSEELKNALTFGYKFEVLWGYTFKSDLVFKDYVTDLYNLRLEYPKTDPMNFTAKILLNSLYGRFGMEDSFTRCEIISKKDYDKFEAVNKETIQDVIDLGSNYLLELKDLKSDLDTLLDNGFITHNVNIAIASAVTAYSRIHMSQFKHPDFLKKHNLKLYYSDTDSAYFNGPLPDSFVRSNILGSMKLEGIFERAIFLAPKVYALKNSSSGEEIVKIKGLKSKSVKKYGITLDLLSQLLLKNSNLKFNPEKWFRNLSEGTISVIEQVYTLKVTDNKRKLLYNNENILVDTVPIKIKNGEIVNS